MQSLYQILCISASIIMESTTGTTEIMCTAILIKKEKLMLQSRVVLYFYFIACFMFMQFCVLCFILICTNKNCCCFQVHDNSQIIRKGIHSHIESYSAFWDNAKLNETHLRQDLINRNVNMVFICGIAYDHCVGEFCKQFKSYFLSLILFFISYNTM